MVCIDSMGAFGRLLLLVKINLASKIVDVELIPKYCKFNRVWINDSEVGELAKVSKLLDPSAKFRAELTAASSISVYPVRFRSLA